MFFLQVNTLDSSGNETPVHINPEHIRSIHEVLNGATITFGDGKTQVVHESPMSILKKLENYKLLG
jgi:uncharacterized protein YlzI (FlbEa/FlbD family)